MSDTYESSGAAQDARDRAEELRPVYCTGPERHPIRIWGGPLMGKRGTEARMWGSPVTCGQCGASCRAAS